MSSTLPVDLDYLVARLHGRRGHLAEAERLDALCQLRTLDELARAVSPEATATSIGGFQQRLIRQMVDELADFAAQLVGSASALMAWLRVRFQVENLKVLVRVFATGKSAQAARLHLATLPDDLAIDVDGLAAAGSLESFIAAAPAGRLQAGLALAAEVHHELPRPIVLEAALDQSYLDELLKRTRALPHGARADCLTIANQEVDTYHLMLAVRGRFIYGLPPDRLARMHVSGSAISSDRFRQMLDADRLRDAARLVEGLVVARLPPEENRRADRTDLDPAVLEALAWNRYLRLARQAFRRNHMRLGAVVAFAAIRRIEMANLITLSEGIRIGMPPSAIRARLIPSAEEGRRV